MCGIAGYLQKRPTDPSVLTAMTEALHHRGPDQRGLYTSPPFAAGMCRLAINDVTHGSQPLTSPDGDVILLYNGEIYNSPTIRDDLETKQPPLETRCDGEVICRLYPEHGEDLFELLDGMFAVALWIESEQKLILARDIPGEKPLYFSRLSDTELVFASEIKALELFPGIDLSLNQQAMWDMPTFLWVPEPATVYGAIEALPPGHLLVADASGIHIRQYANRFGPDSLPTDDTDCIALTRELVESAVCSRLLSDVPVGCFLSSGLDSSIIASVAARQLPELSTFSIKFEDVSDPYHGHTDESAEARRLAALLHTHHHEILVTPQSLREQLERFCLYGDQPFSVSSGLGVLAVASRARDAGVKVLLGGDGADECFGGYSWYADLAHRAPEAAPARDLDSSEPVSLHSVGLPAEQRLDAIAQYAPAERAWAWHYYAHESDKRALFNRDWWMTLKSSQRHFSDWNPATTWTPEDFIAQDRAFYLPNEMLRKVDRMTMAHSVEGRLPFVAPAILRYASHLGYQQMFRNGELKWLLREAFRDLLPDSVLRRPKHGFNVPIDRWLRGDWIDMIDETFSTESALGRRGLLSNDCRQVATRLLEDPHRLHGHTLFSFVMLNRWLERR